MRDNKPHNDMSIEDILESIRNVINDRAISSNTDIMVEEKDHDDDELHLTNIREEADFEAEESILSTESSNRTSAILEDFVQTAFSLGHNVSETTNASSNSKTIESFLENMIKPHMKEWLDANLPIVVKQVVSEEIKRLVANMNKNSI